MQRIQDATAVTTQPAPPTLTGQPVGFFQGALGGIVTRIRYWWLNMIQEELIAFLVAAGLPLDGTATVLQGASLLGRRAQVFTGNGTFTVPANISRIRARVWGGGGGSGGAYGPGSTSGAGAGGGYTEGWFVVSPLQSIAITVGAAGAPGAGTSTPQAGGAGGTSSVGALCSATGGGGGGGNSGSGSSPALATGGMGYGGTLNVQGSQPDGGYIITGSTVVTARGGAAPMIGLSAHSGGTSTAANGILGLFPGGGAAGAANQADGAYGANGLVIIEY